MIVCVEEQREKKKKLKGKGGRRGRGRRREFSAQARWGGGGGGESSTPHPRVPRLSLSLCCGRSPPPPIQGSFGGSSAFVTLPTKEVIKDESRTKEMLCASLFPLQRARSQPRLGEQRTFAVPFHTTKQGAGERRGVTLWKGLILDGGARDAASADAASSSSSWCCPHRRRRCHRAATAPLPLVESRSRPAQSRRRGDARGRGGGREDAAAADPVRGRSSGRGGRRGRGGSAAARFAAAAAACPQPLQVLLLLPLRLLLQRLLVL